MPPDTHASPKQPLLPDVSESLLEASMLNLESSATGAASLLGWTLDRIDGETPSKLLVTASDTLDSDLIKAKACIQKATELLRGCRGPDRFQARNTAIAPGGLALWQKKRIAAYVESNVGARIRVSDLAKLANLSLGHFFRSFRRTFGASPLVYVMRRRVYRSQELMLRSTAPLSDIALECGLSDQAHFTRVFGKIVGITPAAWRRQHAFEPTHGVSSAVPLLQSTV